MFVAKIHLVIDKKCVHKGLLQERFYKNNRLDVETAGPSKKRAKYTENREIPESQASVEHGVFTNSVTSSTSESNVLLSTISASSNSLVEPDSEYVQMQPLNPIPVSKIDAKEQRRIELSWIKASLAELFQKHRYPSKDQLVSPELLSPSKTFSESDALVKDMARELGESLALGEGDPITVTERNSKYQVLSGNRRVMAYRQVGINQIRVSNIPIEEEHKFKLFNFFSQIFKGREDPNITEYGKSTLMLELTAYEQLADKIKSTGSLSNLHISIATLADLIRKFKLNPNETLNIIEKITEEIKEPEIKRMLSAVTPDARHLLLKKGITPNDVEKLMDSFGSDPSFGFFTKSFDARANKKTLRIETIVKKFEEFRKTKKDDSGFELPSVLLNPDFTDCLLTDNFTTGEQFLNSNEDCLVFVMFHHHENASNHVIHLPDKLGYKDDDDYLHNHFSVAIFWKMGGNLLHGVQLTDKFKEFGCVRKSIMSSKDFRNILKNQLCIACDLSDKSNLKLASELLSLATFIGVQQEEDKKALLRMLPLSSPFMDQAGQSATT
ncbi:hypothetical protein CAEBREN_11771 [Caenorhabditis brenneri]|uniref:Uncharacterized protein n=1 Tax=Caenorhabditis brenneri TaxID=135651 RepID=G0NKI7_CAEBE|nr:hypothetical protein CAEBREN_11771 [Caenorhabditis brenneri]